jgi:hypothetical protein
VEPGGANEGSTSVVEVTDQTRTPVSPKGHGLGRNEADQIWRKLPRRSAVPPVTDTRRVPKDGPGLKMMHQL